MHPWNGLADSLEVGGFTYEKQFGRALITVETPTLVFLQWGCFIAIGFSSRGCYPCDQLGQFLWQCHFLLTYGILPHVLQPQVVKSLLPYIGRRELLTC